jgi:hypothetical protein
MTVLLIAGAIGDTADPHPLGQRMSTRRGGAGRRGPFGHTQRGAKQ